MFLKKGINLFVGVSLSLSIFCIPLHAEESFSDFEDKMFKEIMSEDYLNLHFSIEDYEQYGIEKPEVTVGDASWDTYEESVEECQDYLDELHAFDYDSLTEEEQSDYQKIESYLNNTINLNSYPYFDFLFNNSSGVLDSLISNFTEFQFYQKEDIDDYLTLLESVPDYLDECLDVTKKQAEKGYFLTDSMLEETEDAIDKFVEKTDDNELIRIFDENIDAFDGLSDSEKESYKEKNKDIILNSYIPAYKKVGEELEKLKGSRNGAYNVSSLEGGSEYYQALAQYKTSMNTDVQTMLDICTQYLNTCIDDLRDLLNNHYDELDEELEFDSAEEVLSYLEEHLDDFPELQKTTYTASYLDSSVANDSVVAYYMIRPLDDASRNVIKINGNEVSDTTELYVTLSHEGFPGHLYQINYFYNSDASNLSKQLSFTGYTEGWAMYVEKQALEVSGLNEYASEYQALNEYYSYVLDAAVDLGVNGLGWSTSDISNYFTSLGLGNLDAGNYYDFVTKRPGNLLAYGVTLAMYELLEDKAQNALGDEFNQKEFNQVLLDDGFRTLDMVEDDVDAYCGIESTDENNIYAHGVINETTDKSNTSNSSNTFNWILYGTIGVGILAIGAFGFILIVRSRKDDPFQS